MPLRAEVGRDHADVRLRCPPALPPIASASRTWHQRPSRADVHDVQLGGGHEPTLDGVRRPVRWCGHSSAACPHCFSAEAPCHNVGMPTPARVVIVGGGPGGYESGSGRGPAGRRGHRRRHRRPGRLGGAHRLRAQQDPDRHGRADDRRRGRAPSSGVSLDDHEGDAATTVPRRPGAGQRAGQAAGRRPVRRHRPPAGEGGRRGRPGPRPARRRRTASWSTRRRRRADGCEADAVLVATGAAPRTLPDARSPTASGSSPGSRSTTSTELPDAPDRGRLRA